MTIKNIILDLGNVLLDIDYDLTTNAFVHLGYHNFQEMYSQYKADLLFEKLEMGLVAEDDFYFVLEDIREGPDSYQDRDQIQKAWNAMLLDFRYDTFEYLKSVKDKYRLFLLSNTNVIHKRAVDVLFNKGHLDDYFEKAYYSHLVGMRKPNEDIFEFVLGDAGIKPEETLFIDDLYPNIETAKKMGFQAWLLKEGELVEKVIPGFTTEGTEGRHTEGTEENAERFR